MQTILITGAANGIGRATAMHFHGLGWQVIGLDTDTEALAELRGALPRESALFLSCDVGRESEVRNAFEGIGGKVVVRELEGTHITPNVPDLSRYDSACDSLTPLLFPL